MLEMLQGSGARISIATKSDLILRDFDLIKTFPDARVSWSINTLDEDFRAARQKFLTGYTSTDLNLTGYITRYTREITCHTGWNLTTR